MNDYFDREDIESFTKAKSKTYTKEELINLIISMDLTIKRDDLIKLDISELQGIKKRLYLLEEKKFFSRYGNNNKARLYEYEDEDELKR